MEPIVVLVLDPDLWRKLGFVHVLKDESQIKLLEGVDHNRILAQRRVPADLDPDVVMVAHTLLVDFKLSLLSTIKDLFPRANILVHGYEANIDTIAEILIAGAKGYFSLSARAEDLIESLKFVSKGLVWGPPEAIALSLGRLISLKDTKPVTSREDLISLRERTILNLLAKGLSNKEIANSLGLSEVTAKFHLIKLYKRFGVQTRLQLLTYAIEHDLISLRKS
jgi:DNA-binding NarL/FixJ family response regulator